MSNCFVLFDKEVGRDCLIIDPGSRSKDGLVSYLTEEGLNPLYIILTHEHFDHCWGVNQLVDRYHIPIVCSRLCAEAIQDEKRNCSLFYGNGEGFRIDSGTISVESLGNLLLFGRNEIKFFKTPGHTEASISIVVGRCLFTGDTLIKDIRTVTKLPTGSNKKLKESMHLFSTMQSNGFHVFPGHGEDFDLNGYDLDRMIQCCE